MRILELIRIIWRKILKIKRNTVSIIDEYIRNRIREGVFGKRIYYCEYLDICILRRVRRKKEWQEKKEKYEKKYREICIHSINPGVVSRIGEIVPRYNLMMHDIDTCPKDILHVLRMPLNGREYNKGVVELMKRNMTIILDEDCDEWLFLLLNLKNINLKSRFKFYSRRDDTSFYSFVDTKKWWQLSCNDINMCEKKFDYMNAKYPFVCFSNRDSAYLNNKVGGWFSYHNYRDSNICTRNGMVDYLKKRGICCIRMGKVVATPYKIDGVIDYASDYYDDFMDIFLSYKCEFFVNDNSGINSFAFVFGKRQVFTNDADSLGCGGYCGFPQREDNIMLFKLIYNEKKGRYCTLEEICNIEYEMDGDGNKMCEYGVRFVDNTEEDILEATIEMYERINGTWKEIKEDEDLQDSARKIVRDSYSKNGIKGANAYIGRFGTAFLKKHRNILGL